MIGISTQLYDPQGFDIFNRYSMENLGESVERRVSVTKTLDGGSYVADSGFSESDVIKSVVITGLSKARSDNLLRIARAYSRVILTTDTAAFLCVIKLISIRNNSTNISFIVEREA